MALSAAAPFTSPTCFLPHNYPNPKPHRKTLTPPPPAIPPPLSASAVTDLSSVVDGRTLAFVGGGSFAALAAVLSLSDPEKRRQIQAEEAGGGDKEVVRDYFNNSGFQRWRKIYGGADDVNRVQRDIRIGHARTVESAVKMLAEEGSLEGVTVCDAGCGTGSLAIPLAKKGAVVWASDISAAMVSEAETQARSQLSLNADSVSSAPAMPTFEVKDLESLDGKYDAVVCLDVLIHYPQGKVDGMISHLASLATKRLLLSFAPKTFYFETLKRVGELFPGPSKATRAYLHAEADVERALLNAGWRIRKRDFIGSQFYFSKLFEAVPI